MFQIGTYITYVTACKSTEFEDLHKKRRRRFPSFSVWPPFPGSAVAVSGASKAMHAVADLQAFFS